MDSDERDLLLAGIVVICLVLGILTVGIYESVHQARVERECLAAGYRSGDWRWFGPSYCITRQDQTDVVVTLDSARRVKR